MTEERRVIETALNRLYRRIDRPTAGDAAHLRISLAALEKLAPKEKPFTLDGLNMAQVQAAVEGGKVTVEGALDFEEEQDAPRKTLIKWLEERL